MASSDKLMEPNEKRKKKKTIRGAGAMSWDYTGTQQLQHSLDDIFVDPADSGINVASAGAPLPSLHLIYQTIMAQHKQTQGDSKKARVATKQLPVAVSKIAKTCSEIGERIPTIESRANALETELGAVEMMERYEEQSQRFLVLAMSVARCCIASDWLEPLPPTFNQWLARLCSMYYFEMGSYAFKGRSRRQIGKLIWAPLARWLGACTVASKPTMKGTEQTWISPRGPGDRCILIQWAVLGLQTGPAGRRGCTAPSPVGDAYAEFLNTPVSEWEKSAELLAPASPRDRAGPKIDGALVALCSLQHRELCVWASPAPEVQGR
ncbi:hypothetical protein NDU88_005958 [Pleurodeles waltl]|uniref:Uncharacterized protein n=1 Tax=Pleurodeles waltl TaxID=8319 RepID=A0AAV7MY71_PLEWA|nr:hypothetical protein NDU88_005958 [Pleurodeles waltl]